MIITNKKIICFINSQMLIKAVMPTENPNKVEIAVFSPRFAAPIIIVQTTMKNKLNYSFKSKACRKMFKTIMKG